MKAAIYEKAGKMTVAEIEKPSLQAKDDVIIKVVRACVCGSDLWGYGEDIHHDHGDTNSGHEAIGIVEEVGEDITTLVPGDFVIVPFTHGCGHCDACRAGFDGTCDNHPGYTNWATTTSLNIFVSTTVTGPWSKFLVSQATTQKA